MEIGIHTFASADFKDGNGNQIPNDQAINELIDRIEFADKIGIDEVGIGEHHRKEFLDSAAHITLAAAAARTKNIRLASSVTVLSAADPVRVFQNFATLDLVSNGRAEIIAGRGSFTEAYPLFGLNMEDYNSLYAEKLDLLLKKVNVCCTVKSFVCILLSYIPAYFATFSNLLRSNKRRGI